MNASRRLPRRCIHRIEVGDDLAASDPGSISYHVSVNPYDPVDPKSMPDGALEEYLLLCQEMYQEMERSGHWPWPDSLNSENLLESDDT